MADNRKSFAKRYTTYRAYNTYHALWQQQEAVPQAPNLVFDDFEACKLELPATSTTEKEINDWTRLCVQTIHRLPLAEVQPRMIVPLLYSITMHEKHKLHAKFMQALKPCDSAVARVRGTGSKEASDKIMDIVLDCCGELFDLFATVHGKLIRAGVSDVTVQQAITELILERQYSLLWPHYCAKFFSQDDAHVKRVLAFANIVHLSHLGVPQKFWGKDTSDQYSTAITTLRKLSSYKTPYMKAQCIADTGKEITQFVRSLYKDAKERQQLAADDFLPLFAYVVIKAEMQHPYAKTEDGAEAAAVLTSLAQSALQPSQFVCPQKPVRSRRESKLHLQHRCKLLLEQQQRQREWQQQNREQERQKPEREEIEDQEPEPEPEPEQKQQKQQLLQAPSPPLSRPPPPLSHPPPPSRPCNPPPPPVSRPVRPSHPLTPAPLSPLFKPAHRPRLVLSQADSSMPCALADYLIPQPDASPSRRVLGAAAAAAAAAVPRPTFVGEPPLPLALPPSHEVAPDPAVGQTESMDSTNTTPQPL
eukprot:TRINITY_DN1590_c0_g1_i21.p1 TRINITY_DN1590_c0_g1~~TRINITY_DN1590_c0_g1_i21.p1  ORF type:complete len:606 (-),score=160.97 TRINITY_DN1590_c0_g1_i21:101-1696(-)